MLNDLFVSILRFLPRGLDVGWLWQLRENHLTEGVLKRDVCLNGALHPLDDCENFQECCSLAILDLAHLFCGLDTVQLFPDGGAYKARG